MSTPRFPKNPLKGRENLFVDSDGSNPFGDEEGNDESPVSPSAYGVPSASDEPAYQVQYQTIYAHRRMTVLAVGITSFVLAAMLILLSLYWAMVVVLVVCNLSLTVIGCAIGFSDLNAMKAGAMDASGRRLTRIGTWLSLAATIGSIGFVVKLIIDLFLWVNSQ